MKPVKIVCMHVWLCVSVCIMILASKQSKTKPHISPQNSVSRDLIIEDFFSFYKTCDIMEGVITSELQRTWTSISFRLHDVSNADNSWLTQSEGRNRTIGRRVLVWPHSTPEAGEASGVWREPAWGGLSGEWHLRCLLLLSAEAFWGQWLHSWFLLICSCHGYGLWRLHMPKENMERKKTRIRKRRANLQLSF